MLSDWCAFDIESYKIKQNQERWMMYKMLTHASMQSELKYSDYLPTTITQSFKDAKYLICVTKQEVPMAFALVKKQINNKNPIEITLLFTFPMGKGHRLITRTLSFICNLYNEKTIILHHYNFMWLKGPAMGYGFEEISPTKAMLLPRLNIEKTNAFVAMDQLSGSFAIEENFQTISKALIYEIDECISKNPTCTDYSADIIKDAFTKATHIFVVNTCGGASCGFVLIQIVNNIAKILLLFSFPKYRGQMLISRMMSVIQESFAIYPIQRIECETFQFKWIESVCLSHKFFQESTNIAKCNVLSFNYGILETLPPLQNLKNASFQDIMHEKSIEHSPMNETILSDMGSLFQVFFKACNIPNEKWPRIRIDVRSSVVGEGQSSNSIGVHSDFIDEDAKDTSFISNDGSVDEIYLVCIGEPGTRIYTTPFSIALHTKSWSEIWRDSKFVKHISDDQSIVTESCVPIKMDNMRLHTAQLVPFGTQTRNPRLFMRIIVYAPSRMHMVPLNGVTSIPQVYSPINVM